MSKSAAVSEAKKLPICVECAHDVPELYSPNTSPANIKLTICDHCGAFADKYVEYDIVLISLDMILHRMSVYRHLLYNLRRDTNDFAVAYKRLLIAVMIFTCYVKIELWMSRVQQSGFLANFAVTISSAMEIGCYMLSLSAMCMLYQKSCSKKTVIDVIHLVSISLFPHLFYLLVIIWHYPPHFLSVIHFFFLSSTTVALAAYLKSHPFAILFVTLATALNYALFQTLAEYHFPAIHLIASTGVMPKLWQSAILLAMFAFIALATISAVSAVESHDYKAEVQSTIAAHDVVLYGKSYCPYCRRAKQALTAANIKFHTVELDQVTGGPQLQNALLELTGQRTVPNVFVKAIHIGGSEAVAAALSEGRISDLLAAAEKEL